MKYNPEGVAYSNPACIFDMGEERHRVHVFMYYMRHFPIFMILYW